MNLAAAATEIPKFRRCRRTPSSSVDTVKKTRQSNRQSSRNFNFIFRLGFLGVSLAALGTAL
jgi:hypothetical protein